MLYYRCVISSSIVRTIIFACILFPHSPRFALPADRNWTNPVGGSFSSTANWQNGLVPGSSDRAIFDLASQTYTVNFDNAVTNSSLLLHNGNVSFALGGKTYTLSTFSASSTVGDASSDNANLAIANGTLKDGTAHIGNLQDSHGTVDVSGAGAIWTNTGELDVGLSGIAALNIANGGSVSNNAGVIGFNNTSQGTVFVIGAGSTWTNGALTVGNSGTGMLMVQNGGKVVNTNGGFLGTTSGSHGTATVAGTDSLWTSSKDFSIGESGTGMLTIEDGGSVVNNGAVYIANKAGSKGVVTVSGIGSNWDIEGNFHVGGNGDGTLIISDGGKVTKNNPVCDIGWDEKSTGTVTVTGANSTWTNKGLSIGYIGVGMLTITDGGSVISNAASSTNSNIGNNSNSQGTVTIQGVGSKWTNSGNLDVGSGGTGIMSVSGGATVSNLSGMIGSTSQSHGTVNITGAGSIWTSSSLTVANQGTGKLTIEDGGTVISNSFSNVGVDDVSDGTVDLKGAGSSWTSTAGLTVGGYGKGTVNVSNGATMQSSMSYIGRSVFSSHGVVTVTGSNSIWMNAGLVVGNSGIGELTIADGGSVTSSAPCFIGATANSHGMATVGGTDSTWNISGDLSIGFSSSSSVLWGTLNIKDGGKVAATTVTIWSNGTLTGGPGVIDSSVTNRGVVAPGSSPGVLSVTGDYTQSSTGKLTIEIASASSFDRMLIGSQASLGGTLQLTLLAGFVPACGSGFDILDWGSRSGTFVSVQLPALSGSLAWSTTRLYTDGIISVVSVLPGDFDQNGVLTSDDIPAMLSALTDLNVYRAQYFLSDANILAIGDLNHSGALTNSDIQMLLDSIASLGSGSVIAVPEPKAFVLAMICGICLPFFLRLRR